MSVLITTVPPHKQMENEAQIPKPKGMLKLSEEFNEKVFCTYISNKTATSLWEKEYAACSEKRYGEGIKFCCLLRIEHIAKLFVEVPYNLLLASSCLPTSICCLTTGSCCCIEAVAQKNLCCNPERAKEDTMFAGRCLLMGGESCLVTGIAMSKASFEVATCPGNACVPELQYSVCNQQIHALSMDKGMSNRWNAMNNLLDQELKSRKERQHKK